MYIKILLWISQYCSARRIIKYKIYLLRNKKKISPLTWFCRSQLIHACKDHLEVLCSRQIILKLHSATAENNRPMTRKRRLAVLRFYADGRHWLVDRHPRVGHTVRTVSFADEYLNKSYGIGYVSAGMSSWIRLN